MNKDKKFTILVVVMPFRGHMNPMVSFIRELAKNKNLKIIFPGNKADQEFIESSSAEFRNLELDVTETIGLLNRIRTDFPFDKIAYKSIESTDIIMPGLVEILQKEKIDLIIYDFGTAYGKYLIEHLNSLHSKGKLKNPVPPAILFSPSVISTKDVYPNEVEKKFLIKPKPSIGLIFRLILLFIRYAMFCFRYGIKLHNPEEFFMYKRADLNICCVIPEFQTRSHLLDKKTVKFVGMCANTESTATPLSEPLASFLSDIKRRNPLPLLPDLSVDLSKAADDEYKLVYVSFGTVFNRDMNPYVLIVEAAKRLASKGKKLKMVMSVGEVGYAQLSEMSSLSLPSNVLLMKRVPQLEVLKRASLFITHSGQNSTSESMHYGVPMICLPVCGDQPLVAYRVADELGLGVRMSLDDLKVENICESIEQVLDDSTFTERAHMFSKLSHKYDGNVLASNIVLDYLQEISNK